MPIEQFSADTLPPFEQLQKINEAAQAFWGTSHYSYPRGTEAAFLERFVNLADALRPIRPLIESISSLSDDDLDLLEGDSPIHIALLDIAKGFDGIADRWGWRDLAGAEDVRGKYIEECNLKDEATFELPMIDAALACLRTDRSRCNETIKEYARKGIRLNRSVTGTDFDDSHTRFLELFHLREATYIFGNSDFLFPDFNDRGKPGNDIYRQLPEGINSLSRDWHIVEARRQAEIRLLAERIKERKAEKAIVGTVEEQRAEMPHAEQDAIGLGDTCEMMTPDPNSQFTPSQLACIDIIRESRSRMTQQEIISKINLLRHPRGGYSESIIKSGLAWLVKNDHIINCKDCRPRGYGLPDWPHTHSG